MKVVLWICGLFFCFFTYESFVHKPFVKELPLLLLPDMDARISFQESSNDAINFLWDMRSDCIQTDYNFSIYSCWEVPSNLSTKQEISSALSLNTVQLFTHKPLFRKVISFEKSPVVWIEKKIHPVHLTSENLNTDNLIEDFVKMGKNFLPCKIDRRIFNAWK